MRVRVCVCVSRSRTPWIDLQPPHCGMLGGHGVVATGTCFFYQTTMGCDALCSPNLHASSARLSSHPVHIQRHRPVTSRYMDFRTNRPACMRLGKALKVIIDAARRRRSCDKLRNYSLLFLDRQAICTLRPLDNHLTF